MTARLVLLCAITAVALIAVRSRDDAPSRPWQERARAFERGQGARRDFGAAARVYEAACADGAPEACRRLAYAIGTGRGVDVDWQRAGQLFEEACHDGDAASCGYLAGFIDRDLDMAFVAVAACDAADLDACVAIHDVAAVCDEECQRRQFLIARRGCTRDSIPLCIALVDGAADSPWTRDARSRLGRACDVGDPDACHALPGRAIPPAELCAAGDRRACD